MAKRILALAIAMIMLVGTFTIVSADAVMTLTAKDVDATAIADGGNVDVEIYIDAIPKAKIQMMQIYFDYDETKLTFDKAMRVMQVWDTEYAEAANATWTAGTDNILFNDGTYGLQSFDKENGFSATKALVKLRFKKVAGATGDTTVDIRNVIVTALEADNEPANKGEYSLAAGTIAAVDATVTLTTAPAVSVAWTTDTEVITGAMRFLFDAVVTGGEVVASGVKFLNSNDFEDAITSIDKTGAVTTFSADVNEIPEDAEAGTYYAAGYVKIGDDYKWEIVGCTLN